VTWLTRKEGDVCEGNRERKMGERSRDRRKREKGDEVENYIGRGTREKRKRMGDEGEG
jgi:hypothetical protein